MKRAISVCLALSLGVLMMTPGPSAAQLDIGRAIITDEEGDPVSDPSQPDSEGRPQAAKTVSSRRS